SRRVREATRHELQSWPQPHLRSASRMGKNGRLLEALGTAVNHACAQHDTFWSLPRLAARSQLQGGLSLRRSIEPRSEKRKLRAAAAVPAAARRAGGVMKVGRQALAAPRAKLVPAKRARRAPPAAAAPRTAAAQATVDRPVA